MSSMNICKNEDKTIIIISHSIIIIIIMIKVIITIIIDLLCVSCPSATEFSAILYYFLSDQAQTHLDHFNVLDELWCQISFKSDYG